MNYQKQGKAVRKLRRMIPAMGCKAGCSDCCGPVPFIDWEADQIKNKKATDKADCPYITATGCEIYENRPIICRLFATVKELPCPHGCKPDNMLPVSSQDNISQLYRKLPASFGNE